MKKYDADREPNPDAWLELDEEAKIDLKYHRRNHPRTSRVRLHSTFHTIVENQLASKEPAVADTLARLRNEGLSRHDAVHAIGSVLAAQLYEVMKRDKADAGDDLNKTYATELRKLTAEGWRNAG